MCAWIRSCGGKAKINPAIIISGDTINYPCDNSLAAYNGNMRFTYPNQPNIYNVDMTDYNKISVTVKNSTGNSRMYWYVDGVEKGYVNTPSSDTFVTELLDISSYTGIHTIKFSDNAVSSIDISSMVLTN